MIKALLYRFIRILFEKLRLFPSVGTGIFKSNRFHLRFPALLCFKTSVTPAKPVIPAKLVRLAKPVIPAKAGIFSTRRLMKTKIFVFSTAFLFGPGGFGLGTKPIDNLDFLTLSVQLQYDYPLPDSYKRKQLKFEGNYARRTKIQHNKKKNHIRFIPIRVGSGTLVIKDKKDKILRTVTIEVKKSNLHKIAKEVSSLLTTVDGIEVKIINNKVIIDGEILLPRDMDRIYAVISQYDPKQVQSLVNFSPAAQNKILDLIRKAIGNDEIQVMAVHNRFVLEGEVNSAEEKKRAGRIAVLYTQWDPSEGKGAIGGGQVRRKRIATVQNHIRIKTTPPPKKDRKILWITAHYVELKKDFNKGFMFQWTPTIQDGTSVTASAGFGQRVVSTLTATVQNFFPKLNWAKSFGFARILHNATVVVENEKPGTIDSTTQVPHTTISANGNVQTSSSASSRVTTTITPRILGSGQKDTVSMNIQFQVTNPTGRTNAGPITSNKTVNTNVWARSGQTAVLGGLFSSSMNKDYNRLPQSGTKATPLFNLAAGKNYDTNQSQFVVFITPVIRSTPSYHVKEIKRKFKIDQD